MAEIYQQRLSNVGISFFICVLSAAFAIHFGHSQFAGYDLSPLIDLNWRFSQGHIPGVDFINTLPTLLLVWTQLFSHLSPVWANLIWANIAFTFLIIFLLIATKNPSEWDPRWTAMVTTIICLPLIYTNHLWHSSLSQLAAIAFFFSIYESINKEKLTLKYILLIGLTAGIVSLSKQNLALPLIAGSIFFFMIIKVLHRRLIVVAISIGAALALLLSTMHLGLPPEKFIQSYTLVLGRVKPDLLMFTWFKYMKSHYPLIIFTAVITVIAAYHAVTSKQFKSSSGLLCVGFLLTSLLPILTDWDAKLNNLPLPLFVLVTFLMYEQLPPKQGLSTITGGG